MQTQISLSIPTDWDAISLKKYLNLQKELKNYEDDESAMMAIMLKDLCGLDPKYLSGLSITDYNTIKAELGNFIGKSEYPLQKIVKWKGKEYGFEPNLSQMAYGAYLDIVKYDSIAIDDKWVNIMNILYREVTDKTSDMYEIKPYSTAVDNTNEILEWGMDIHFGSFFFFINLLTDLVNSIPNFTMEVAKYPSLARTLQRSGVTINQLLNYPVGTSQSLVK
jgi:hypothetical protein